MNREFLQLAHDHENQHVGGWFWSEKLDGMRAFWDGGISRGLICRDVPYANTEKDGRLLQIPIATGLWSRYGKVIHAPDWWLNKLPAVPLDGELYAGRGRQQFVMATVKDHEASADWQEIKYFVFDMPNLETVFGDGRINNPNMKKTFKDVYQWAISMAAMKGVHNPAGCRMFQDVYKSLRQLQDTDVIVAHDQELLVWDEEQCKKVIEDTLNRITDIGGEGLIFRKPESLWTPHRNQTMLKLKKLKDSEATVIGYTTGRETDRGSKLLGLMGALKVRWNDVEFELSGFTDAERELEILGENRIHRIGGLTPEDKKTMTVIGWAEANPGQDLPLWGGAKHFPRGSTVTFRYRELTDDGIPKEARYYRKKVIE